MAFTLFTAALIFAPATMRATADDLVLPDIGDPASQVLSRTQEEQLGDMLLAEIRGSLNVLRDPELNTYIQSLGIQLLAGGAVAAGDFAFMLIGNPAINAFAAPGGIVAVNTGLLTTAKTESELAAVMAHEIAHVTQRHLARAWAQSSKLSIATALGILGAILATIANPEVGQAALYGTMAAGVQSQLRFTRTNEQEADRVGIQLLSSAGFEPAAMPRFLARLHDYTQLNYDSLPEYLSSHPVTLSRISDTQNRAEQMSGDFVKDRPRFHYAKARALALTSNPATLISRYEQAERAGQAVQPVDRYAYGIALSRAGQHQEAIKTLQGIDDERNAGASIDLALAEIYLAAGRAADAAQILQGLNEIYPYQEAIVYHLARARIDLGQPEAAMSLLEDLTRDPRHNPELDKLMAEAAAEAKEPWLSHEAMADYYAAHGHYGTALGQMDLALRARGMGDYTRVRLESRRKELKAVAEERREGG